VGIHVKPRATKDLADVVLLEEAARRLLRDE